MTDTPEQPSQDTTRDWSGEEEDALRIERERTEELLRKQRERE